ncbi:MAG TPA: response regulator [Pyrinomonadaceae bacterium]|jgi:CheY-like chemotaxis protein
MDSKHILLVEDSQYDVELILTALAENHVANEVVITRDGEEALNYLYRRGAFEQRPECNPAVVFLDLKMPKVDGLEVLRQIKADPVLKAIPVVMLTSSREDQDLVSSYRLGVNAYVVKPVNFSEFLEAISQVGMFWGALNQPPPRQCAHGVKEPQG